MTQQRTVWALSAVCFLLLVPRVAGGQQDSRLYWQGASPPSSLQSPAHRDSSQPPMTHTEQPRTRPPHQPPAADSEQEALDRGQPLPPGAQETEGANAQGELPVVWPPLQPAAANTPGYLGLSSRSFYRERFCMHAMTIQGVEVAAVAPDSPAARAGLRPAKVLSSREVATAAVAGLLVLSPAAPLAAAFLRASGGVDHGDIILAVGGERVKTQNEFERALAGFGPQTVVYLTVRRGEAVLQLPVRLESWPTPPLPAPLQQVKAPASH